MSYIRWADSANSNFAINPPAASRCSAAAGYRDRWTSGLYAKLKNAQGLRQAILHHAFTGQLVPQDPNDEPASDSELLKRIAAEREGRGAPISRRRRAAS